MHLNPFPPLAVKGIALMTSLGELSLGIYDRLATKQVAAMDLLVEHGNDTLDHAFAAKDIQSLMKGQMMAAQDLTRLMMAESRTNLALLGQAGHEYQHWLKKNLNEVTNELSQAVPAI